jgi:hypothetical protein
MEDPVLIQVWGKVAPARRREATDLVRTNAVFSSEMELRKAVMNCLAKKSHILLSPALGYQAAQQLASAVEGMFDDITYTQQGYWPMSAKFCNAHNYHYGGVLGCHLCRGFFTK